MGRKKMEFIMAKEEFFVLANMLVHLITMHSSHTILISISTENLCTKQEKKKK